MSKLQYSALDADNSEIRLLDIAPGDGDDEICCSLSVVSLNSHPQFEALSYVWGDHSIRKNVTVDGASHSITVNLESALRDLRYPSKIRTVWADAICINQVDIGEKNHQIPLMGDIYRKASGVVAYLGHSSPYLELFFDWSHAHSRKWSLLTSQRWIKMTLRSWISQKGAREKDILSLKAYLGFIEFISHAYFARVWTFQEFILPSRKPIFAVGKKSFQMGHISRQTWHNLYMRHHKTASKAGRRVGNANEPEAKELVRHFIVMVMKADLATQMPAVGNTLARPREWDVVSLFNTTRPRHCFDPLDKIFALHALVQEHIPGICAPDYSKSVDTVLLETLSKIYQYRPSIIQCFMILWPPRASSMGDASGPSWLPDITTTEFQYMKDSWFTDVTLRISEDFTILTLGARFVGTCYRSIIRLGSEPEETLRRIAGLMYSNGEDLHSFAGSEIRMRRKEHHSERILYTLGAWTTPRWANLGNIQALPSMFSTIAQFKGIGKLDDIPFTAEQRGHLTESKYAAKDFANKAFFWTDTGLFGTCSEGLQEGDTIVMTSEFSRLLAVRPRLDPSGEPNHYHMVGWVFVDGLVDGLAKGPVKGPVGGLEGLAWDAELFNEIQETPLSDIYIH